MSFHQSQAWNLYHYQTNHPELLTKPDKKKRTGGRMKSVVKAANMNTDYVSNSKKK